ncbi:AraC family transcriptional regulator [Anaerocolumna jejuensis DSM 15929]|uniref:AraC family transcriptional regulator n=1 Tax=Anaerocolumna jejuensis DSM 15929 TaxID=1121322 RepID=A0A1M6Q827_9FIRM|nr:AraC family transcriptional regulator [Anaerocolumna jejuensis]SHK16243.1 AraC family transcriptional regulator [Anaerocolumna jejuensis DSM 15929]
MHAWEAIQKTLDYIEEHIGEDIKIEVLAETAALSLFYYQRLFSRLVKKPLREYIKLRRMAIVLEVLQNKNSRILDIALEYGFGSHETFTRAFKEAYGMTPEQYREKPVSLNRFDKPDLLLGYTLIDEGVPLISDGLVLEMNRRTLNEPIDFMGVIGYVPIAGQIPVGESTGVDMPGEIWRHFHKEKDRIARIPDGREVGVAYMGDAPEGCFTYFAGAEIEPGVAEEDFQRWQLPAREYIICGFEAGNFLELVTVALNKAIKYSGLWLEKHGLVADVFAPELYYSSTPEATYMELLIPFNKKQ